MITPLLKMKTLCLAGLFLLFSEFALAQSGVEPVVEGNGAESASAALQRRSELRLAAERANKDADAGAAPVRLLSLAERGELRRQLGQRRDVVAESQRNNP
jgi:hypothetical protein